MLIMYNFSRFSSVCCGVRADVATGIGVAAVICRMFSPRSFWSLSFLTARLLYITSCLAIAAAPICAMMGGAIYLETTAVPDQTEAVSSGDVWNITRDETCDVSGRKEAGSIDGLWEWGVTIMWSGLWLWSLCRASTVWKRLIPYLGWHDFVTVAAVCTIAMCCWGTSAMGDVAGLEFSAEGDSVIGDGAIIQAVMYCSAAACSFVCAVWVAATVCCKITKLSRRQVLIVGIFIVGAYAHMNLSRADAAPNGFGRGVTSDAASSRYFEAAAMGSALVGRGMQMLYNPTRAIAKLTHSAHLSSQALLYKVGLGDMAERQRKAECMAAAVANKDSSEAVNKFTRPRIVGAPHESVRAEKVKDREGSSAAKRYAHHVDQTASMPAWRGLVSGDAAGRATALSEAKERGKVMMVSCLAFTLGALFLN